MDLKGNKQSGTKSRISHSKLMWTIPAVEFNDQDSKSMDFLRIFPNYGKFQFSQRKYLGTAFHISNQHKLRKIF